MSGAWRFQILQLSRKQPYLKNEVKSDAYDLLKRVEHVAVYHIFNGSLYLIDECFYGVIGIVGVA